MTALARIPGAIRTLQVLVVLAFVGMLVATGGLSIHKEAEADYLLPEGVTQDGNTFFIRRMERRDPVSYGELCRNYMSEGASRFGGVMQVEREDDGTVVVCGYWG